MVADALHLTSQRFLWVFVAKGSIFEKGRDLHFSVG